MPRRRRRLQCERPREGKLCPYKQLRDAWSTQYQSVCYILNRNLSLPVAPDDPFGPVDPLAPTGPV